jgi:hypoxanthine phosphoribosyltransferase
MWDKSFEEIKNQIALVEFTTQFDAIIAIARGGIVPGVLVSNFLKLPLYTVKISFRDDSHQPIFDVPKIIESDTLPEKINSVLIVDDVSRTGKTLNSASEFLNSKGIQKTQTLAVNGHADYSLYNEECFKFPWLY